MRVPRASVLALLTLWLAACLALAASASASDSVLEVIELRHRPAAEVVPVLEPLLSERAVERSAPTR